ncbi:MAG TPA: PilZ domain-containing protein [Terriglobales bacterium]|nr:PilZ domain-containing protein [Terriglobales bacterium]
MTHFPHPNPQRRAARIQFGNTIPALVKLEDGQRAKGKLESISLTGGCLHMAKAIHQGDLVEIAFQMQSGPVQGMAEMLSPRKTSQGILQPFRFIALDDNDHHALSKVVDSISDQSFLGIRSAIGSLVKSH